MSHAAVKKENDEAEPEDVLDCHLQGMTTGTTDASLGSQEYRRKLLDALGKKNRKEVSELIRSGNKENAKTLRTLNDECRAVALRQKQRRDHICQEDFSCCCCIKKIWNRICACIKNCICKARYWCKMCCKDELQPTEDHSEEEKEWIEILSNPLYISLEWLRRIDSKSGSKDEGKENEDENEDVITTALRDSHLLEMIAGNDLHQHKDEYKELANRIEEFAVAVVKGSTREQLIDIMDTEGDGCLKQQKPWNFSQSLSLLKIAADEKRKKFVASAKCQSILNEVVYFGCPSWQKKKRITKILWSFLVQLLFLFLPLIWIPYSCYRALKDCPCCDQCGSDGWKFIRRQFDGWKFIRRQFEHPYSKFVNHTISYMVFLGFLIAASFQDTFGTTWIGLEWIDWVIIAFVLGLLIQELLAAIREGLFVYFSKWWNIVDSVIILLFVLSFLVWVLAYFRFGNKWKPEKDEFIAADVIFSSAIIIAFFHLTHIFQVDSVLGPLQLSLYKMLGDVWKFLLLFLVLHLSFSTGLTKMYSYYVASQVELHRQNMTHYEKTHHFASHWNALSSLFWLLLGIYDEEKVGVEDPVFVAMSIAGQIFMIVYVVCMVIVALNMLIAMMSKSYDRIMDNSDNWRFSRARMWLESIDRGNVIPSPFNLLYYSLKVITKVILVTWKTKCCCLCHYSCQKGGKYKKEREDRLKTLKTLVDNYLEDPHKWSGKNEGESQSTE